MSLVAYLIFNGNCREAVEHYADAFGVEVPEMATFGGGPQNPDYPLPDAAKNLIMNTRLDAFGDYIMFSDTFPGSPFTVGNHSSIAIVTEDQEKLQAAFNKLKEGGKVELELQETFWSKSYGSLTDKFGVHWQFNLGEQQA
ncbi:VOC family protein [Paenibacillus sp. GSMTC-2017]|uniref:VOC family protein n=1 Tax=Paenibacillus sp. GSMTC-2017 TaxID=2794350 RepID=UPI0018D64776|nr:VOC family protein [Paenibacillus sp. GSMTC-2017]MBH5316997.1 VOC family protein [Paenibacillus sp. GSMTC-2017]